jgi:hypothetical protein
MNVHTLHVDCNITCDEHLEIKRSETCSDKKTFEDAKGVIRGSKSKMQKG